jgi:4-amino-4-deoxy-L-arabinose transferase-like glycosyltransferase
LARLVSATAPDSLIALRLPSALLAGGVVLLAGLIAREFGGGRAEQVLAGSCMAVSAALLLIGHLFGTTMVDLFCWVAAACWVAARLLRGGDPR